MRKEYESPLAEIEKFTLLDAITTSAYNPDPDVDPGDGGGGWGDGENGDLDI